MTQKITRIYGLPDKNLYIYNFHKHYNKIEKSFRNYIFYWQKDINLTVFQSLYSIDIYIIWKSVSDNSYRAKDIRLIANAKYLVTMVKFKQEVRKVL